ncbi:MAG: hypothetical protein WCJ35_13155 [Planctomycetota bacterium]
MHKQTEYMSGWVDTSIHDFLSAIEVPPSSMAYALITCLDSNPDIRSLASTSKHLNGIRTKPKFVGKGLILTTRKLLDAERHGRIFFGFDEIWFSAKPIIIPKPDDLIITGPGRLSAEVVDRYGHWLDVSGCTLGLGDGTGMNFCFRVRGLVKHIATAFNYACDRSENTVSLL